MIEPTLKSIPAGVYTLGVPVVASGVRHIWEGPVSIETEGFLIGETAVTVQEFKEFLIETKGAVDGDFAPLTNQAGNLPAGGISWEDAGEYVNWLAEKTGKPYRLPTADEWEIAARGGLEGRKYPWGDEAPAGRCNYDTGILEPVKSYEPNGYGLYGMAGSIWCWCNDLWIDRVKHDPPVNTPTNRPAEINRILRGGSYLTKEENNMMMRCAYIHEDPPELRHACLGMRVACGL